MDATRATGATLAKRIRDDGYSKYVVFHSDYAEAEAGTLALWTMHTHLWQSTDVDATPYIQISAPTSEAGKSRVFDVARLLVHKPFVVVDPTPASLYRSINAMAPTLMVDEADMLEVNKSLRVVFNAGFQPGTPIPRGGSNGDDVILFQVFCPKIFCGITGTKPPLTEATLSRCIQIPLRRKAPHEIVTDFNRKRARGELAPLRGELAAWARLVAEELTDAEPAMPRGLSDRQRDAWAPLLAIADLIGWGREAREWAVTLFHAIPKPADPAVQILRDVKRVLDAHAGNRIPSAVLAAERNALDERDYEDDLTPMQLGRRMAGFGIHADSSPWREGGRNSPTVRGYTFRRGGKYTAQWLDAFVRYDLISL